MQKYDSLKQIAETDFYKRWLDHYGITPNIPASIYEKDGEMLKRGANLDKKKAVLGYIATDEGRMELSNSIDRLMSIYTQVRPHFMAIALANKVKVEAAEELSKKGIDGQFILDLLCLRRFISMETTLNKGNNLYTTAVDELSKVENMGLEGMIDLLMDQPDWLNRQIVALEEADKHFYESIPGGRFPPVDQIEAAAEIIFGSEWTSKHSVRYYLNSILKFLEDD